MQPSPSIQPASTDASVVEESFLPSYEAAVDILDSSKLPSYRRTFSARFHPYKRPTLRIDDEIDRLFNTVFDEEYVPLNVPAARRRGPPCPREMVDDAEATQRHIERAEEFELRVRRLDSTISAFIEGVSRAHTTE